MSLPGAGASVCEPSLDLSKDVALMELRHLRYFVAVAEDLHFRRAAERLHVAQPAVSEQIRKLEAELGVRLLSRNQRSVELTDAGAAMLPEARRVLVQADLAYRAAREADEQSIGQLRLGYLPDALPSLIPHMLRRFTATAPGIRLRFETAAARRLVEDVREQRLDAAVVCLPAAVSGLRVVPIGVEETVAAVPEPHPCARESSIALSGLERTPLVHLPRAVNPAFHDGILGACREAGIAPALIEVAEPSVEQVLLAVASGAGIALLPESAAKRYTTPGVRFRALAPPAPSFDMAIVTRSPASTTTAAFLRLAQDIERPPRKTLAVA
jgi:DNA-binding transcriptional LysR family regulator